MDALKKNGFWVVLGVLALGALGFYIFGVMLDRNKQIDIARKKLEQRVKELEKFAKIPEDQVADPKKGALPVAPIVKYWNDTRENLENERTAILKRYRAVDEAFEKLLGSEKSAKVTQANFVSELRARIRDDLVRKHAALIDETKADQIFPIIEPKPGVDEELSVAQKQFNICVAVANAVAAVVKDAAPKDKEKDADRQATYQIVKVEFKQGNPPKDKAEVELIPATVELRMPFPSVAKLVAKLLAVPVPFLEIAEIKADGVPFTVPEQEPWKTFGVVPTPRPGFGAPPPAGGADGPAREMRGFDRDVYLATTEPSNPKTAGKDAPELHEPSVRVVLHLNALDFELGEKKKAAEE